ncbi:uncharacterized protein LOC144440847 [Glandiceps talaboti]
MRRPGDHNMDRKTTVYIVFIIYVLMSTSSTGESIPYKYCHSRTVPGYEPIIFNCSYLGLQEIPTFLPNSTFEVNLQGNAITQLYNTSFTHLPNLKKLDLSNNQITKITAESFKKLSKLEELDLSRNVFLSIPCNTFKELTSLKTLRISAEESNNYIPLVSLDVYTCSWNGLDQLEYLDLSFYTVNPNTDHCVNFELFAYLPSLKFLDLSWGVYKDVCINTKPSKIPTLIKRLQNQNHTFGQSSNTKLNITHLYVSNNQFTDTSLFNDMHNLQYLDLSFNLVRRLQNGTFNRLTNLTHLNMSWNHIDTIDHGAFDGLFKVVHLDLSFNWVKRLYTGTFNRLTNLTHLNMSGNDVNTIDHGAFDGLFKVTHLDLSSNKISCIKKSAFMDMTCLTYLNLLNNCLNSVEFNHLINLQSLKLDFHFIELSLADLKPLTGLRFLEYDIRHRDNCVLYSIRERNTSLGNWLCSYPQLETVQSVYEGPFDEVIPCMTLSRQPSNKTCNSIDHLSLVFSPDSLPDGKNAKYMPIFFIDLLSDTPINWLNFNAPTEWMPECPQNKSTIKVETLLYNGYDKTINNVFSCFDGLKALYLNHSNPPLESIDFSDLTGLENLEILDLSNNKIFHEVPHIWYNNKYHLNMPLLKILHISDTDVIAIEGNCIFLSHSLISTCFSNLPESLIITNNHNTIHAVWSTHDEHSLKTLDMTNTTVIFEDLHSKSLIFVNLTEMIAQIEDYDWLQKTIHVPSLVKLDLSHSKLKMNNHYTVFSDTRYLKYVDLSYTQFDHNNAVTCSNHEVHMFFQDFDKLEHLDISHSEISVLCQFYFRNLTQLKYVDLSNNYIVIITKDVFTFNTNLTIIDLSGNQIKQLDPLTFRFNTDLKIIDLSGNKITQLDLPTFKFNTNLTIIDLSGNHIIQLDPLTFTDLPVLSELYFENNPLGCDCDIVAMHAWMTANQSIKFTRDGSLPWQTYQCETPIEVLGKPVLMINFQDMICGKGFPYEMLAGVVGATTVFVVIGIIVWIYRWKLIYKAYRHMARRRQRYPLRYAVLDDDIQVFQYDAFVCYNSEDSDWVEDKLLPTLEGRPHRLKLCTHERDFILGKYIQNNIDDCMTSSRKILFLISDNFVGSSWCEFELQLANQHILDDNVGDKLMFVILEEVPQNKMSELLMVNINMKTHIKWPGDNNKKRLKAFWKNLARDLTE